MTVSAPVEVARCYAVVGIAVAEATAFPNGDDNLASYRDFALAFSLLLSVLRSMLDRKRQLG